MTDILEMARMTSPELADAAAGIEVALQPIGATEQHGPHLALGTDFVAADRIARRVAGRLGGRALLLPVLPYGVSPHHMGFPGTVTLDPETVIRLCCEVARSLDRQGIGAIVFVNGHHGNAAVLQVAATRIRYELGVRAAVAFYFAQASDRVQTHARTPRFGHACEIETSVLMHLADDYVRTDALAPGAMRETGLVHGVPHDPFALQMPVPFDRQTGNGAFGDARLASAEAGQDIVDTAVARTVAFIDSLKTAAI